MATVAVSPARLNLISCLTSLSAGLLVLQATVVVGFAGLSDVFAVVVAVLAVLAGGSGIAAVANIRRAPKLSRTLILVALAGSVVAEPYSVLLSGVSVFLLAIAAGLMYLSSPAPASGRESDPTRDHPGWAVGLGWFGIALHLTMAVLYTVAASVTPFFGPVLYLRAIWVGLWAALLLFACRLLRTRADLDASGTAGRRRAVVRGRVPPSSVGLAALTRES